MIEPPSDTKIFVVNTYQHIGSGRGLLVNPNQYIGNGKGHIYQDEGIVCT